MSYALDTNLLLYACDRSSPFHQAAVGFLEETCNRRQLFCLAWPTVMGFLRIATHPRVFQSPLSPEEARSNVNALVRHPYCRVLSEQDGFWPVYQDLADTIPVRGNLVPDAHLVAILLQHGIRTLYSTDTDFRRFPQIRVKNPL